MLSKQNESIAMYQRVQDFLRENPPPAASAGYAVQKKTLDDIVARLTEHTTDQVAGRRLSRAEVQRQKSLRRRLREEHLSPLAQIARATLPDVNGIGKALHLPNDNLATLKYAAEAKGMRAAATPYAAAFIEAGRAENFLEQLDAAIEDLRQSVLGKARKTGQHIGARAGMSEEIKRGRQAVDNIDTVVRSAFRGNLQVLAKWQAVKRLRLQPRRPAGAADAPAVVAPAASAAPVAQAAPLALVTSEARQEGT
jgi:hypothetical protein